MTIVQQFSEAETFFTVSSVISVRFILPPTPRVVIIYSYLAMRHTIYIYIGISDNARYQL